MATITVYVASEDEERRRSKKRNAFALFVAGAIAIAAIGDRQPPVPLREQAPPPPRIVEKIVYVDRPVPVFMPAPETASPTTTTTTTTIATTTRPVEPPPTRRRTAKVAPRPAPQPVPAPVDTRPQPQVVPAPAPAPPTPVPRRALTVEPRNVRFVRGGRQAVTILNPFDAPITVRDIHLSTASIQGFHLGGHKRCIKTLQPDERCSFFVTAIPSASGVTTVVVNHDG